MNHIDIAQEIVDVTDLGDIWHLSHILLWSLKAQDQISGTVIVHIRLGQISQDHNLIESTATEDCAPTLAKSMSFQSNLSSWATLWLSPLRIESFSVFGHGI